MTKTTEQKFQLHANFWFEFSIEDLNRGYVLSGFTTGEETIFERMAQSQYEVISQMAYQLLDYIDNNAEEEE